MGDFTMDMLFRTPGNCAHRDGMSLQTTTGRNLLMSLEAKLWPERK